MLYVIWLCINSTSCAPFGTPHAMEFPTIELCKRREDVLTRQYEKFKDKIDETYRYECREQKAK